MKTTAYSRDPDRYKENAKRWQRENPEKVKAYGRAKQRRKRAAQTPDEKEAHRLSVKARVIRIREEEPEKLRVIARRYRNKPENRAKINERRARPDQKLRQRHRRLLSTYGIGLLEFQDMLEAQSNKCAVCQQPFFDKPNVDHDHSTNKVRGLLCRHCNTGLGHFRDNPTVLQSAITYLNEHTLTSP